MEENKEKTPEKKPRTSKSVRLSTDEQTARMRLAFTNGKLPAILPVMQTVGYTEERLNGYLEETLGLEELNRKQKKEYGEQYAETEKFDNLRAEIAKQYRVHRALLKLLFRGNLQVYTVLRINDEPTVAYGTWIQLVLNFYTQIKTTPSLLSEVKKVNIQEADIDAALTQIENLRALKKSQRKELAEAQAATEERDKAFDELYALYREFIDYARILLADDQALEALGIVVKR